MMSNPLRRAQNSLKFLQNSQGHYMYSTASDSLRRSYLYIPSSSSRMLEKSLAVPSDTLTYDLEDSVAPLEKDNAREQLVAFLQRPDIPEHHRIAVRTNSLGTPSFAKDIEAIAASPAVNTLILPKIHSAEDLNDVSRTIAQSSVTRRETPLRIIPSIESAKAMWNLREIASWKSEYDPSMGGCLSGLLFAAEDYCADTSILRSRSRQELLYTRSQIVIAAKAFNLEAIDMVCVNYKDTEYLKAECTDGRQLGFTGKQAIHPSQVAIINFTFVPTPEEILRAAKIVHAMESAHATQKGAAGLDGEMIDAPMIKQAENTMKAARLAGLEIPSIS